MFTIILFREECLETFKTLIVVHGQRAVCVLPWRPWPFQLNQIVIISPLFQLPQISHGAHFPL